MDQRQPVYTETAACQDCYKCVRNCPVKSIRVQEGVATVLIDRCILCGNCVAVCPSSAKRVRDDLPRVRELLASGRRVVVSLAPSYVAAFPGIRPGQMVAALRRLGFSSVSETALGAQQVSAHAARLLAENPQRAMISSACPAIVAYLQRHRPEQARLITPLLSPLLAHCKMLREAYGPELAIVFVGPCIAKKSEADAHPDLLDAAITFADLGRWLEAERILPEQIPAAEECDFVPERATDGALYPVDGGMIAGIRADCRVHDCALMAFSGLGSVRKALDGLEHFKPDQGVMLELLACEGGCVNGPVLGRSPGSTVARRYAVLRGARYDPTAVPRPPALEIGAAFAAAPVPAPVFPEAQVREALRSVGKADSGDELNCGGCGYDSCREFARAMLAGMAERAMCVTYMRQLAHKKANALIQKMSAAVVIVDAACKVVECNAAFARMFTPDAGGGDEAALSTLERADLASLLPFHRLVAGVLRSGEDHVDRDVRHGDAILHVSIFTIEKNTVVGAIIQDVTRPAVQKEEVIRRARDVIQRNLSTVQRIACLLGENAAESEITLRSIIDSFTPPAVREAGAQPGGAPPRDDPHDWRKHYRR